MYMYIFIYSRHNPDDVDVLGAVAALTVGDIRGERRSRRMALPRSRPYTRDRPATSLSATRRGVRHTFPIPHGSGRLHRADTVGKEERARGARPLTALSERTYTMAHIISQRASRTSRSRPGPVYTGARARPAAKRKGTAPSEPAEAKNFPLRKLLPAITSQPAAPASS